MYKDPRQIPTGIDELDNPSPPELPTRDEWDDIAEQLWASSAGKYCVLEQITSGWMMSYEDDMEFFCSTHQHTFFDSCKNSIKPRACPRYGTVAPWDVAQALREAYQKGLTNNAKNST